MVEADIGGEVCLVCEEAFEITDFLFEGCSGGTPVGGSSEFCGVFVVVELPTLLGWVGALSWGSSSGRHFLYLGGGMILEA